MTAPKHSVEDFRDGEVHREGRAFYVLSRCEICDKERVTRCSMGGKVWYSICQACASRTPEKRAIVGNLFRGKPKTPEQIEKLRRSSTGNKNCVGHHLSQETKEKLSKAFKGRKLPPEVIKRMSEAQKNRPPKSAQHRANLSKALKGRRPSDNTIQASIKANTGRPPTQKQMDAIRKASEKNWADPEWRRKRMEEHKVRCNQPEFKEKSSQNAKKRWADPEYKERMSAVNKENANEPSRKAKLSAIFKEKWQNPEYRDYTARASLIGSQLKPNLKEVQLLGLINVACPNQYKYTGDGEVVIGGKVPDFTNTNGQKKVIEMFGDYYHSIKCTGRSEEEEIRQRLDAFREYGYSCLIIWERELKKQTPEQLVARIQEFNNG